MIYKLFNTLPEIESLGLSKQVVVATYEKASTGTVFHRNKRPSNFLWDNITIDSTTSTSIVLLNTKTSEKTLLESSTTDGSDWRHYNNVDKTKATIISLLVTGDENDMYECNPSLDITVVDGIAQIKNVTTINGKPWQHANRSTDDIQGLGCMWMVSNASDPNYLGMLFIACGNKFDFNRGSGRLDFCKITKRTDVPLETVITGADINKLTTDYIYKAGDIADPDTESIIFSLYHGVKAVQSAISVPLNSFL